MKNLHLIILFAFITFFGNAQELVTKEKESKLIEYISLLESENQIIGTVSIFENNNEKFNTSFGQENLNIDVDDPEVLKYQIGSITKMFTAVLLYELVDDGKLNLDETLDKYSKKIPNSNKITIRNMLNHTSGLGNYVLKNDSLYFWLKEPVSQNEIYDEIIRQDVMFQPGDSMMYSNSAYYLLARILEKEYGSSFKNIVKKQITEPLGMKNTFAIGEGDTYENLALSYEKVNDEWSEVKEFHFPNASGAGDIISTAYDLNIFISAVNSGKIISKESLEKMKPKEGEWFGEGIMMIPFYDEIGYGHGGDTFGTHSVMSCFPEKNISVVYSINGEHYPTNDFGIGVLSILFDQEFELPVFSHYQVDTNLYPNYEGTYSAEGFPIAIKIYEEDAKLYAKGDGQPAFALNATSEHNFEFKKAGIAIEFKPSNNMLILKQAGQEFELTRQ